MVHRLGIFAASCLCHNCTLNFNYITVTMCIIYATLIYVLVLARYIFFLDLLLSNLYGPLDIYFTFIANVFTFQVLLLWISHRQT